MNGELDGQWQLMEIAYKNEPTNTDYDSIINKKDDRIYWNFQLDLMMIRTIGAKMNGFTEMTMARFNHNGNKLDITKTYIHYRERDSLIDDRNTNCLEPMGIKGNAEKFDVKELNNKRMVLTTSVKSLTFRKF